LNGDVSIEGTSLDIKNEEICITNFDDNIFVSWDSTLECDEVAAAVCDGKKGIECTSKNADLTKAKNLKIKIGKIELEFTPQEYLFFNKNHSDALSCRIGDPETLRGGRICNNETTKWGVGKLFFQKAFPLFEFKNDGSSTLKFLKSYNFPDKHETNWFFRWGYILLIILLIIVIVVFVVLILKKKKNRDSEDYTQV